MLNKHIILKKVKIEIKTYSKIAETPKFIEITSSNSSQINLF